MKPRDLKNREGKNKKDKLLQKPKETKRAKILIAKILQPRRKYLFFFHGDGTIRIDVTRYMFSCVLLMQ